MGTIGDLLGLNLQDFEPETTDNESATDLEGVVDTVAEAVWAAIIDETGVEPEHASNSLGLVQDLDMDELSRWAVVAMIERDLKCTIADAEVHTWNTVDDIIHSLRPTRR